MEFDVAAAFVVEAGNEVAHTRTDIVTPGEAFAKIAAVEEVEQIEQLVHLLIQIGRLPLERANADMPRLRGVRFDVFEEFFLLEERAQLRGVEWARLRLDKFAGEFVVYVDLPITDGLETESRKTVIESLLQSSE